MSGVPARQTARLFILLAAFVAAPHPTAADAVDDFVKTHMERHQVPGLSLAICRDGQVVKAQGYGLANVELDVPAKPETIFQSGSVGKQFTAMAVMLLVEEGKLSLDDPLPKYFAGAPGSWKGITVRHLLTHTSGIKDWGNEDIDFRKDYTEAELAKIAMKLKPDFVPGTQWSYSNTGYALLGFLVGKVSGKFYGDFLEERVFGPLGMEGAQVISETDIVKNRAAGYVLEDGKLRNQSWVSPSLNTTADGSLYLTALDLAKWDAALGESKLLRPEGYTAMWSPVLLRNGTTYPYGFGWSFDEQRGEKVIEHGGSWQGFRTAIVRYPARKLTVIVLANLAQAEPERIATTVAGIVEPALAAPDARATVPDPDPARTAALRGVLEAWGRGTPSPKMGAGLRGTSAGTAREKSQREGTAKQLAAAKTFVYLGEDDVASRDLERRGETVRTVVYCALRGGEHDRRYRFFLNERGEVVDFASEAVD
jgi:CubicO group peptidase (beta-lactamase class C family)